MAVTMTDRSSAVDGFLRAQRNKLSEEKARMRVRETSRPVVGILPCDDGRNTALRQRRQERLSEYQEYINEKENRLRKETEPRPGSIAEVRKKMQKEREDEVGLSSHENKRKSPVFQREDVGVAKTKNWDDENNEFQPTVKERRRYHHTPCSPDSGNGLVGLGRIGYREEESPEEKRKRQSQYRAELMEQMKSKGVKAMKMGHTQLFDEEEEPRMTVRERRRDKQLSDDDRDPPVSTSTTSRRIREATSGRRSVLDDKYMYDTKRRGHRRRHTEDEDDEEEVMFHHHPPAPGPHPFHGYPYHPPQYPSYVPPYYYPQPYPPMYPPQPHPQPHPPRRGTYYEQDDSYPDKNPYLNGQPNYRRPPPRTRSPELSAIKSRWSPTPLNKEVKWKERDGGGGSSSPQKEEKAAELRAFLNQQIREKKEREEREKQTWEKVYQRIEKEAEVYDPWGKPGGGAPLTDALGNVVTERGQLRKSFDDKSPRVSEEDRKKLLQEKNKRDLEEQIKENQERQMREKIEKQQQEEREELKIKEELDRLNLKGKREIEEERQRQEEEELAKGRKMSSSQPLSKQELAEQRLREELERKRMREEEEKERLERLAEKMAADSRPSWKQRSLSPPIPTLRNKPSPDHPTHTSSPPIPALRPKIDTPTQNEYTEQTDMYPVRPSTYQKSNEDAIAGHVTDHMTMVSRPPSTEVQIIPHHQSLHRRKPSQEILQGLSDLKNHIRKNINSASEPVPLPSRPSIPMVKPNSALQQFNKLKYSKPSEQRAQFWKEFPDPPRSNTALEIQQEALLRHQRKEGRRQWDTAQTSQNHIKSGPMRPRPPSGHSMFTIDTLDIDSLAMRNEERARRLEAILTTNDRGTPHPATTTTPSNPQLVLDEFLHRQKEGVIKRRSKALQEVESESSLNCDTTFVNIPYQQ